MHVMRHAGELAQVPAREVDAARWDAGTAREAAIHYWLTSKKSAHTREAYERDIRAWFAWCDVRGAPVNDARRADVDAWRDDLAGLSPATVARKLAAVSSFYDYWLAEDVVTRNPAKRAARPAVSTAPVSISLTRHQAARLLAYVDGLPERRTGVIVRLLAETGMRVGELTGAHVADLGLTGGRRVLWVTRKGGKRQALPLATSTYERVADYLDGRTDGYLLHVQRTERRRGDGTMDRGYVRQLLRRVAKGAGLEPEVVARMHPHVLRHSVATLLSADHVPVSEIQMILGHANLATTQRYIHHQEDLDNSPTYRMHKLLAAD